MTRIPDIIERGEASAEDRFDEATKGLPDGQYRCDCGRVVPITSLVPAGPNPYSSGVCQHCAFGDETTDTLITGGSFPRSPNPDERPDPEQQARARCGTCGGSGKVTVHQLDTGLDLEFGCGDCDCLGWIFVVVPAKDP